MNIDDGTPRVYAAKGWKALVQRDDGVTVYELSAFVSSGAGGTLNLTPAYYSIGRLYTLECDALVAPGEDAQKVASRLWGTPAVATVACW
jgi:hypothetical protein